VLQEEEWSGIYRACVRDLYRHVSRRVGGERELAEDVTQEAWLRALSAWRRKGAPRNPMGWLITVADNLLRNQLRRLRPERLPEGAVDLAQPGTREPRAARLLAWALGRLPRAQAELIAEHHLDGRSLAEMAAARGLGERAVEGRLRRARQALERRLAPYLEQES
jgi:RNA polymerase sigma-70 factor (ECF subfamily)